MKLVRWGLPEHEKPGIIDSEGRIRDLSDRVPDIAGNLLRPRGLQSLREIALDELPIVDEGVRIGPCVGQVGKFLCIGLNYSDHAEESGMPMPVEPVVFGKATSAISGPYDPIVLPYGSSAVDWEVELGVVIGEPAKRVPVERALEHVAGYCVINDLSERNFQLKGTGQWIKGKSCDSFGPIGPWLVTADEVGDPQQLTLLLEVDGRRYQNGHTSNMHYSVAQLISYLSHFFTLHPGDIIATGTPAGVGLGQKPYPIYLKENQVVTLQISKLGKQRQRCVAETLSQKEQHVSCHHGY